MTTVYTWTLLLIFVHAGAVSITTDPRPFTTKQACEDAGADWSSSHVGVGTDSRQAYCVPHVDTIKLSGSRPS